MKDTSYQDLEEQLEIGDTYHGRFIAEGRYIWSPKKILRTENGISLNMVCKGYSVEEFVEEAPVHAVHIASLLNKNDGRPYIKKANGEKVPATTNPSITRRNSLRDKV